MYNISEILFSNKQNTKLKSSNILFGEELDFSSDVVSVYVSYFSLKEDKHLKNDNFISPLDALIAVGFCEKTGMINVCHFDDNNHIYFWVKHEEVNFEGTFEEFWEKDDVRIHVKALKEKWTTEKNTKKE